MRICYVADGASIHTQRWVNYFAGQGHDVHLICWKLIAGYHEHTNIHLLTRLAPRIWVASQYFSFLFWAFQVRQLVRRIKPDIVDGQFLTVYGFLAARSGFRPLVVSVWGSDILVQPGRNPLSKFTARYASKKADVIICLFPIGVAREQIARLGIDSSKIRTVLLGVDTAEFSPSHRDDRIRRHLNIDSSQPIVISTRALAPIYDVETLVKAIPLVVGEMPKTEFVIAGTGKQQGYLVELARALGVSGNTKFVGWVPRAELPEYLASADIYVSTSLSDGASNSLLEAMACGVAPVATDIHANRPWVNDGNNGFLFPTGDYRILASRIVHLLGNREKREALGRRSREIVQEKAEQRTEMKKLERVYQELAEQGSVSRKQTGGGC
jgi:glycosyltransferase involved in cell wall biosynthesis